MIRRIHCEWGLAGIEALRDQAAVLVIVDVLSFSTAVDIALGRGAEVVPLAYGDEAAARRRAVETGALVVGSRRAGGGQLSLSPASLMGLSSGQRIVLPSPNGSRLSLSGGAAQVVCAGLRNAASAAHCAQLLAGDGDVAVIPAGERWPDQSLRPAMEDLIGAGAVIDALTGDLTPEAGLALRAYRAIRDQLEQEISGCLSGQELIQRGFEADVGLACQLNVSDTAPVLRSGIYRDHAEA
jgi:2-phosphosulfolactate phosphatase